MSKQTRTYTITARPEIIARFERLLALLHWSSRHGHMAYFGMPLDGDGGDGITVSPEPGYKTEVDGVARVGYDVELAYDHGFGGLSTKQR